jgi:hypothetical protein
MHNQVGCGFIMCIAVCLDIKVMSLRQVDSNRCSSVFVQLYKNTALQPVQQPIFVILSIEIVSVVSV